MTDYKKALDCAIDYIMEQTDYCTLCVNSKACNKQFAELEKQGIEYSPDRKICKDSVKQHFLAHSEK